MRTGVSTPSTWRKAVKVMKTHKTLYATFANQEWFVKRASSVRQFVLLCVIDERERGYEVPPKARDLYVPDYFWDEKRDLWCWLDGRPFGKKLPGRRT